MIMCYLLMLKGIRLDGFELIIDADWVFENKLYFRPLHSPRNV